MDGIANELPHFFIGRTGIDAAMAAKVGRILDEAGHRVVLQQSNFANRNFMERMDAALTSGARVIALLTPQYLTSDDCAGRLRLNCSSGQIAAETSRVTPLCHATHPDRDHASGRL